MKDSKSDWKELFLVAVILLRYVIESNFSIYFLIFSTLICAIDHATKLQLHLVLSFGRNSLEIENAK